MTHFIYLFIVFATAWETDNFSCRHQNLQDSSNALNAEVNRRIQNLLTNGTTTHQKLSHIPLQQKVHDTGFESLNANERETVTQAVQAFMTAQGLSNFDEAMALWSAAPGQPTRLRGCDRSELLIALKGAIGSPFIGTVGSWAENNPAVSQCGGDGIGVYSGYSLVYGTALTHTGLSPTVRIGNTYLGTDKLEHFLSEGYQYYEKQMQGGTLAEILELGTVEENTFYGLAASGIKSYADMASNYSGYLFWKNVTDGTNPYFICTNGSWQQARQFNWNDYVNPAWDEALNCSEYLTTTMQAVIDRNVRNVQARNNVPARACPVTPSLCAQAHEWVPDPVVRTAVIHPSCLNQSSTEPTPAAPASSAR
jgi:hypothetical protein